MGFAFQNFFLLFLSVQWQSIFGVIIKYQTPLIPVCRYAKSTWAWGAGMKREVRGFYDHLTDFHQ